MRCGAPVGSTGQYAQFREAQARPRPKTGEAFSKAGSACSTCVGVGEGRREVEAVHGSVGEHQVRVVAVRVRARSSCRRGRAGRRRRLSSMAAVRASRSWGQALSSYIAAITPVVARDSPSSRPSGSPVGRGSASSRLKKALQVPGDLRRWSRRGRPAGSPAAARSPWRTTGTPSRSPPSGPRFILRAGQGRVHRAVQDQPADTLGEQPRVRRAEERAVRGAHVRQLLVAQHRAQDVHVAGRLDRGDVAQQPPERCRAALRELLEGVDQFSRPPAGRRG